MPNAEPMALQDLRLALDAATRAQAWGAVESIQKRIDQLETERATVVDLEVERARRAR